MLFQLLTHFNWAVLIYFFLLNGIYLFLTFRAFREIQVYVHHLQSVNFKRIFELGFYKPLTVIAPAYNESATIISSVKSLLNLHYPEFEILVINDGSSDQTLEVLKQEFRLVPSNRVYQVKLKTQPVHAIYESLLYPQLHVIDKQNGGKADALNAGVNFSQYPLICSIDADSLIETDGLLRATRPFLEDKSVIATGGTVRIANGCKVTNGHVTEVALSKNPWVRFQVVEYLRAFLFGRMGWNSLNAILVISGAFGIFLKSAVLTVGGYRKDCIGEDMELVVRMHRHYRLKKIPYRVVFVPDPVCWTEAPEEHQVLCKQRKRWQKGLYDSLKANKPLFFNPHAGIVGLLAYPFFFFFELLGPFIEVLGYFVFVISLFMGWVNWPFALLFLSMAILLGVLLSASSLLLEELSFRRYPKTGDILILFLYGILENFGYRQLLAWWRLIAMLEYVIGKRSWGEMNRKGFSTTTN
ncbi:MAG TPA: glycosyl transferase [Desulfosporosinus sp.]|nr:glycosyl transferase [Desulfosporosinus sp.]